MADTNPIVVVVGAINVDFVVASPRLPGPGETVVGGGLQTFGGGKGANAAVAAARAGARVKLIAAVGDDDTGRSALASFVVRASMSTMSPCWPASRRALR
jgi:ribokinase